MIISFDVKGVIIRTRNFASLYDSGLISDGWVEAKGINPSSLF